MQEEESLCVLSNSKRIYQHSICAVLRESTKKSIAIMHRLISTTITIPEKIDSNIPDIVNQNEDIDIERNLAQITHEIPSYAPTPQPSTFTSADQLVSILEGHNSPTASEDDQFYHQTNKIQITQDESTQSDNINSLNQLNIVSDIQTNSDSSYENSDNNLETPLPKVIKNNENSLINSNVQNSQLDFKQEQKSFIEHDIFPNTEDIRNVQLNPTISDKDNNLIQTLDFSKIKVKLVENSNKKELLEYTSAFNQNKHDLESDRKNILSVNSNENEDLTHLNCAKSSLIEKPQTSVSENILFEIHEKSIDRDSSSQQIQLDNQTQSEVISNKYDEPALVASISCSLLKDSKKDFKEKSDISLKQDEVNEKKTSEIIKNLKNNEDNVSYNIIKSIETINPRNDQRNSINIIPETEQKSINNKAKFSPISIDLQQNNETISSEKSTSVIDEFNKNPFKEIKNLSFTNQHFNQQSCFLISSSSSSSTSLSTQEIKSPKSTRSDKNEIIKFKKVLSGTNSEEKVIENICAEYKNDTPKTTHENLMDTLRIKEKNNDYLKTIPSENKSIIKESLPLQDLNKINKDLTMDNNEIQNTEMNQSKKNLDNVLQNSLENKFLFNTMESNHSKKDINEKSLNETQDNVTFLSSESISFSNILAKTEKLSYENDENSSKSFSDKPFLIKHLPNNLETINHESNEITLNKINEKNIENENVINETLTNVLHVEHTIEKPLEIPTNFETKSKSLNIHHSSQNPNHLNIIKFKEKTCSSINIPTQETEEDNISNNFENLDSIKSNNNLLFNNIFSNTNENHKLNNYENQLSIDNKFHNDTNKSQTSKNPQFNFDFNKINTSSIYDQINNKNKDLNNEEVISKTELGSNNAQINEDIDTKINSSHLYVQKLSQFESKRAKLESVVSLLGKTKNNKSPNKIIETYTNDNNENSSEIIEKNLQIRTKDLVGMTKKMKIRNDSFNQVSTNEINRTNINLSKEIDSSFSNKFTIKNEFNFKIDSSNVDLIAKEKNKNDLIRDIHGKIKENNINYADRFLEDSPQLHQENTDLEKNSRKNDSEEMSSFSNEEVIHSLEKTEFEGNLKENVTEEMSSSLNDEVILPLENTDLEKNSRKNDSEEMSLFSNEEVIHPLEKTELEGNLKENVTEEMSSSLNDEVILPLENTDLEKNSRKNDSEEMSSFSNEEVIHPLEKTELEGNLKENVTEEISSSLNDEVILPLENTDLEKNSRKNDSEEMSSFSNEEVIHPLEKTELEGNLKENVTEEISSSLNDEVILPLENTDLEKNSRKNDSEGMSSFSNEEVIHPLEKTELEGNLKENVTEEMSSSLNDEVILPLENTDLEKNSRKNDSEGMSSFSNEEVIHPLEKTELEGNLKENVTEEMSSSLNDEVILPLENTDLEGNIKENVTEEMSSLENKIANYRQNITKEISCDDLSRDRLCFDESLIKQAKINLIEDPFNEILEEHNPNINIGTIESLKCMANYLENEDNISQIFIKNINVLYSESVKKFYNNDNNHHNDLENNANNDNDLQFININENETKQNENLLNDTNKLNTENKKKIELKEMYSNVSEIFQQNRQITDQNHSDTNTSLLQDIDENNIKQEYVETFGENSVESLIDPNILENKDKCIKLKSSPTKRQENNKYIFQIEAWHKLENHTGARIFSCDICPATYKRHHALKRHFNSTHLIRGQLGCHLCSEKILEADICSAREQLEIHLQVKHPERSRPRPHALCLYCECGFTSQPLARRHLAIHRRQTSPHLCIYCPESFPSLDTILAHHLRVHGEKYFACLECERRFSAQRGLDAHLMSRHVKQSRFSCQRCDRSFSSEVNRSRHVLISHQEVSTEILEEQINTPPNKFQREKELPSTSSKESTIEKTPSTSLKENRRSGSLLSPNAFKEDRPFDMTQIDLSTQLLLKARESDNSSVEEDNITGERSKDNNQTSNIKETLPKHEKNSDIFSLNLNLKRSNCETIANNNQSKSIPTFNSNNDSFTLSGEWVIPRKYVCAACHGSWNDFWDIIDHKWEAHPNINCTHYEIVEGTQPSAEILYNRHVYATETSDYPIDSNKKISRKCTKCGTTLPSSYTNASFHAHLLECAGDLAWTRSTSISNPAITSNHSNRKNNRKWRPFGRRRRRGGANNVTLNSRNTTHLSISSNDPSSNNSNPGSSTRRNTTSSCRKRASANQINKPELRALRAARRAIHFEDLNTTDVSIQSSDNLKPSTRQGRWSPEDDIPLVKILKTKQLSMKRTTRNSLNKSPTLDQIQKVEEIIEPVKKKKRLLKSKALENNITNKKIEDSKKMDEERNFKKSTSSSGPLIKEIISTNEKTLQGDISNSSKRKGKKQNKRKRNSDILLNNTPIDDPEKNQILDAMRIAMMDSEEDIPIAHLLKKTRPIKLKRPKVSICTSLSSTPDSSKSKPVSFEESFSLDNLSGEDNSLFNQEEKPQIEETNYLLKSTKQKSTKFICSICQKVFRSALGLQRHIHKCTETDIKEKDNNTIQTLENSIQNSEQLNVSNTNQSSISSENTNSLHCIYHANTSEIHCSEETTMEVVSEIQNDSNIIECQAEIKSLPFILEKVEIVIPSISQDSSKIITFTNQIESQKAQVNVNEETINPKTMINDSKIDLNDLNESEKKPSKRGRKRKKIESLQECNQNSEQTSRSLRRKWNNISYEEMLSSSDIESDPEDLKKKGILTPSDLTQSQSIIDKSEISLNTPTTSKASTGKIKKKLHCKECDKFYSSAANLRKHQLSPAHKKKMIALDKTSHNYEKNKVLNNEDTPLLESKTKEQLDELPTNIDEPSNNSSETPNDSQATSKEESNNWTTTLTDAPSKEIKNQSKQDNEWNQNTFESLPNSSSQITQINTINDNDKVAISEDWNSRTGLGIILGHVNQILDSSEEPTSSEVYSTEEYTTPIIVPTQSDPSPESCSLPWLQQAMGATDEEMALLERLGEPVEITDLDKPKTPPPPTSPTSQSLQEITNEDNQEAVTTPPPTTTPTLPTGPLSPKSVQRRCNALLQCYICDRRFMGLAALRAHLDSEHQFIETQDDTTLLEACLISMPNNEEGANEEISRQPFCASCREVFTSDGLLSEHSLREHRTNRHRPKQLISSILKIPKKVPLAAEQPVAGPVEAEGLRSHISSALGGLLDKALKNLLNKNNCKIDPSQSSSLALLQLASKKLKNTSNNSNLNANNLSLKSTRSRTFNTPLARELRNQISLKTQKAIAKSSTNSNDSKETFDCSHCFAKFQRATALKRHIIQMHPTENQILSEGSKLNTSNPSSPSLPKGDDDAWRNTSPESEWSVDEVSVPQENTSKEESSEKGIFYCSSCGLGFSSPTQVVQHQQQNHTKPQEQPQRSSSLLPSTNIVKSSTPSRSRSYQNHYNLKLVDQEEVREKAKAALRELSLQKKPHQVPASKWSEHKYKAAKINKNNEDGKSRFAFLTEKPLRQRRHSGNNSDNTSLSNPPLIIKNSTADPQIYEFPDDEALTSTFQKSKAAS